MASLRFKWRCREKSSSSEFQFKTESKADPLLRIEFEAVGSKAALRGKSAAGRRQMRPGGTCIVQNVIYGGFYAREKKDIIGSL